MSNEVEINTEDMDVARMPLVDALYPERPEGFTEVIYRNGDTLDLTPENILFGSESHALAWHLLDRMEASDQFDELLAWAIRKFADDHAFVRELLYRFDRVPATMGEKLLESLHGMIQKVFNKEEREGVWSSELRGIVAATGEEQAITLIAGKGAVGAALNRAVALLMRGEVVDPESLFNGDVAVEDATRSS